MRLLVTGGAGFIGATFVHSTVREHPDAVVTVLDAMTYAGRRESLTDVERAIRLIQGDITDAQLVSLKDLPLFRGTIPSKLQASMACGVPVVCSVAGDAAKLCFRSRRELMPLRFTHRTQPYLSDHGNEKLLQPAEVSQRARIAAVRWQRSAQVSRPCSPHSPSTGWASCCWWCSPSRCTGCRWLATVGQRAWCCPR